MHAYLHLSTIDPLTTTFYLLADTRGSYLPGDSTVSAGPNDMNLQVDSTSPDFSFPHSSTEADLMGLEVDEGVGTETAHLVGIRDGLGLGVENAVMVSSSTPENEVVVGSEITSDNLSCSDNTISTSNQNEKASSSAASADSTSN